jgi:hypothetical protein
LHTSEIIRNKAPNNTGLLICTGCAWLIDSLRENYSQGKAFEVMASLLISQIPLHFSALESVPELAMPLLLEAIDQFNVLHSSEAQKVGALLMKPFEDAKCFERYLMEGDGLCQLLIHQVKNYNEAIKNTKQQVTFMVLWHLHQKSSQTNLIVKTLMKAFQGFFDEFARKSLDLIIEYDAKLPCFIIRYIRGLIFHSVFPTLESFSALYNPSADVSFLEEMANIIEVLPFESTKNFA